MPEPLRRLTAALSERSGIERELGAGDMTTVYLAEDLKHHREVAVKVLRPEVARALGAERFLREIRLTAGLQHPRILMLIDSGEAGGALYCVMPNVSGEWLRTRLPRAGALPLEEAVAIAKGVAAALDYAHRQGVVHRDIKPKNILVHEGEPMVAISGSSAGTERLMADVEIRWEALNR